MRYFNDYDVLLFHNYSFLAGMIRTFQGMIYGKKKAYYNHIGIWWNGFIYEATEKGIVKTEYNAKVGQNFINLRLKENFVLKNKIDLYKYYGYGYDFTNLLFYQAIRCLTHDRFWIGKNEEDMKFMCGEFVAYILNETLGYNLFENPERIAPSDFLREDLFFEVQKGIF